MPINGREKGKVGEREFFNLLSKELGLEIKRNLQQSRGGGCDNLVDEIFPFAIEVKRQENLSVPKWWEQALGQAINVGKPPALAYRQSRKPWKIIIPLGLLTAGNWQAKPTTLEWSVEMGLEGFLDVCRQLMSDDQ